AVSLSIGLGLFVAIQTWGYTMFRPFAPHRGLPDLIISFKPCGLPLQALEEIKQIEGIDPARCAAVAFRQAPMAPATLAAIKQNREIEVNQDNLLVIGLDAEIGLNAENPILDLTFLQGDKAEALAKMRKGGFCLVPDTFYNQAKMGIGSKIAVLKPVIARPSAGARPPNESRPLNKEMPPAPPAQEITYEIAGVVNFPWHLLTAWTGMRGMHGAPFATFSPIIVNYRDALLLTDEERLLYVWANKAPAWKKATLPLERRSPFEDNAHTRAIKAACEAVAAKYPDIAYRHPQTGREVKIAQQSVAVMDEERLVNGALWRADDLISRFCQLPLWALLVSLLAMANTIVASIRSRRWELGVLRAVGMTRAQFFRFLLAEAVLVVLVACSLSLFFGIASAWCV
ncbi:MAG: FtsX-like permease family protein, partial [Planctomycetota bacterium]|nr:FtsX-like permease family protein [Planctomycetota bacterium]